jgi:MoxR-like ATPase
VAKGFAFIQGRAYVVPEDVKAVAPDVLRHRIVLSYEAAAENMTADAIIGQVLGAVAVP